MNSWITKALGYNLDNITWRANRQYYLGMYIVVVMKTFNI